MTRKGAACIFAAVCFVLPSAFMFSACGKKESPPPEPKEGEAVRLLSGTELDYDRAFFDGFDNGVSYDNWYIGKQAWGAGGNGGVIPENVNYTDDGVVIFSGNGEYYTRGDVAGVGAVKDGTLTGGALISKFLTGPGRYEIKMKVLPRLGACSAFWTFAYDGNAPDGFPSPGNHEIDIELPGGNKTGGDNIGFDSVLNTNYWSVEQNISQDKKLSDVSGGVVSAVNDGRWHTFGFDWYTVEPNESETVDGERPTDTGKVVYYIDGIVTAINDAFVPFYQSRLWLGVWFPHNTGFVGDALFEKDYMSVDYVSYIPFKNMPYYEDFVPDVNGVADISEYPTKPVVAVKGNLVSNGDFEYAAKKATNTGWEDRKSNYSSSDYALAQEDFKTAYEADKAEYDRIMEQNVREYFEETHPALSGDELEQAYAAYKATEDYEDDLAAELVRLRNAYIYPEQSRCYAEESTGYLTTCGARIVDCGRLTQTIDSVYGGYEIDYSFMAKGKGTATIRFLAGRDGTSLAEHSIGIDKDGFTRFSGTLTAPEGTRYVQISFTSFYKAEVTVDDVVIEVA
ncbi:MAG: glycoside hydrolase family 16 protein [Clostridiales bacterium]|nr:glycoside hydrolase family 16 protein [Clostridiales bacterium]